MDTLKEPYILAESENRLQIRRQDDPRLGPVFVDFTGGAAAFRRLFGGGRKQAIAKAAGLKKGATPFIVDATAGLGKDAFVLASLGCRVHMVERIPAIAMLLKDGLKRAMDDIQIGSWVAKRMSFEAGDSRRLLSSIEPRPDVVYMDPMFPEKKKPALSKKDMRIFKDIVGPDADAGELLEAALKAALDRVVVKRPSYAGFLGNLRPDTSIKTRSHRFDIYLVHTSRHERAD